ncbi:MAG: hypothetical protein ACREOO_31955 [bacterium]
MFIQSKKVVAICFLLTATLGLAALASAQTTMYGGRGLLRVFTAEPLGRSQFFVHSSFLTYLDPTKRGGKTLGKDYTINLGFTWGLTHSLEATVQAVPYQDDQLHVWGPPGDTRVGLKLALPARLGGISTGLYGFTVIPTAKNSNVPYEPYSSGKLAVGMMGLATIDMTQSFPLVPLKLYLNFGYLAHDLRGSLFASEKDQYVFGAGIKFPIRSFVLHTEYTGEVFVSNDSVAFAEGSTRLTQGIKFLGPWDLIVDLAADLGLHKVAGTPVSAIYQKDYADWKLVLSLNYQFGGGREESGPVLASTKREDKRAQRQLDEIKTKRETAQRRLQDMEDVLKEKTDATENSEENPPR